ncbi:MAG TPA: hypothetical protein VFH77_04280 [Streptomyces sp.]|nr:hypothetical protein [Streptomyces sp.]
MSNDVAYPVLRTRDPGIALDTARQLVMLGVRPHSEVSAEAEVTSTVRVRQIREAFPEAWCSSRTAPSGPDVLPITVSMFDQPVGTVEEHFTALVGSDPAEIRWSALQWPGVPERRLRAEGKHAEVTLLLNCDSPAFDARTDTHLVLVHVRRRNGDGYEHRLAQWLAQQAGQQVIGPPQS